MRPIYILFMGQRINEWLGEKISLIFIPKMFAYPEVLTYAETNISQTVNCCERYRPSQLQSNLLS